MDYVQNDGTEQQKDQAGQTEQAAHAENRHGIAHADLIGAVGQGNGDQPVSHCLCLNDLASLPLSLPQ